ncbi:MAG: molybdopterin-dependent oxidoreductase, partial [Alphaproteobacteria bacterium]|nr:molybdopterin-dependent oxidoreductase [Alphaproteobacteria bacterium]
NDPETVLVAQLMGIRPTGPAAGRASTPASLYTIPNQRMRGHVVSLPMIWETPLRTGNLRDPNGPQVTFAFESFIDELATLAGADPVDFRLRLLEGGDEDQLFRRARSIATVRAAVEAYGWDSRPSPNPELEREPGPVLAGRGVAYTYRNGTVIATIAAVEVNRETGRVRVNRLVCAHDCGLVINPAGLKQTVECAMLHGLSRALWEEVNFDNEKVTSVDWASHPSLRHSDTPDSIEVVIVNGDPEPGRPDLPPWGAGEGAHKPMIAAVANAVHDATGVRLRRAPFRRERVLSALRATDV